MSHLTSLKTAITDLDLFQSVLVELGLTLEQGDGLSVRDYYGSSVPVVARVSFGEYSLGLKKAESGYELTGDFWGVATKCRVPDALRAACHTGGTVEEITRKTQEGIGAFLGRRYAVAAAKREVKTNSRYRGYTAAEEKDSQGEVIRLVLSRRRY